MLQPIVLRSGGPTPRDLALGAAIASDLARLLANAPLAGTPGLHLAQQFFEDRLRALGFTAELHATGSHPPILVATRRGRGRYWLGLSGHYDVERVEPGWTMDPFLPVCREGRLYSRGSADNLGPLLLRLATLPGPDLTPSLVWVLQGEEEVGSPAAHAIYPTLRLPPISLWLEETGYFERSGAQRVLMQRPSAMTRPWVHAALVRAHDAGRATEIHDRVMNKAFGAQRCPFLAHLVGDSAYLAIGPNDPDSRIHAADESLPLRHLALSADQLAALLLAAAEAT